MYSNISNHSFRYCRSYCTVPPFVYGMSHWSYYMYVSLVYLLHLSNHSFRVFVISLKPFLWRFCYIPQPILASFLFHLSNHSFSVFFTYFIPFSQCFLHVSHTFPPRVTVTSQYLCYIYHAIVHSVSVTTLMQYLHKCTPFHTYL